MSRPAALTGPAVALALLLAPAAWGEAPRRLDRLGDPLPEGALARLGTARLRCIGYVLHLEFSPDGKALAAVEMDNSFAFRSLGFGGPGRGAVRIWDAATGKPLRVLSYERARVRAAAFTADWKFVVMLPEAAVAVWDVAAGKESRRLPVPERGLGCVAFSPDGKAVAGGAFPGTLYLWDAATGREIRQFQGPPGVKAQVERVAFSPDGKLLAAGNNHLQGVWVFDVATGRRLHHLTGHTAAVFSLAFAPGGRILASGSYDGTVRLWEVATGKQAAQLRGKLGPVWDVRFSPDGELLATASAEGTLLWDSTGNLVRRMGQKTGRAGRVAFSPDGKTLAWSVGREIRLGEVATGKERPGPVGNSAGVEGVAFSPNGKLAATCAGQLRLWDARTGAERPLSWQGGRAQCAAFSPDGKLLAAGDFEQTIRLMEVATGQESRRFTGESGRVELLGFLAGGRKLLSFSQYRESASPGRIVQRREDQARLWDVSSGRQVGGVPIRTPFRAALPPDGRLLATGPSLIHVHDTATGQLRQRLGSTQFAYTLALSPDGRRVAHALDNEGVAVLEVASAGTVARFESGAAFALAFSPDGGLLAVGGVDGTVGVWDLETAKELRRFKGHQGAVLSLVFSPDRKRLLSGGNDTTALLWDVGGLRRPEPRPAGKPAVARLEALWGDLSARDPRTAYQAVLGMARAGGQAAAFLKGRLGAALPADPGRLARLIKQLDDKRFAAREQATRELARLGRLAEPELRAVLAAPPSAEVRSRVLRLLKRLPDPGPTAPVWQPTTRQLQTLRAVEVLERLGTPEARELLGALARGADLAYIRDEVQAALNRLAQPGRGE
jgi:WD40 repeat protein